MANTRRHQRFGSALAAGAIAITANTLALKAADLIPLATAKGGLLRLIAPWVSPLLDATGAAAGWRAVGAPAPNTPLFQTAFHVAVGIAMALFYVYALEPLLRGPAWIKGTIYAVAVWIMNAALVLPATGEGLAGSAHLTVAGIVWFAAAHTVFFVTMAVLFEQFTGAKQRSRVLVEG